MIFKGIVNRELPSLLRGSLEIMLTVPLRILIQEWCGEYNVDDLDFKENVGVKSKF